MGTSFDSQRHLSSNKIFYFLIAVSFVISIVISMILVGGRAESTLLVLREQASVTQAQLTINNLSQFLDARVKILQDLSKQPILANSVMGSESSQENIIDFIDDYLILGAIEDIAIVNIFGEVVYTNDISKESSSFSEFKWFDDIVNNNITKAITIISNYNGSFFRISVPVIYNGYAEGVLVVDFSTSLNELLSSVIESDSKAVDVYNSYFNYTTLKDSKSFVSVNKSTLSDLGLVVDYKISSYVLENKKILFMRDIAISIVASLMLSFSVLLLIGRKIILNPFKKLEQSEREIRESEERFNLAVNGSNDGLWDWVIETNSVFYSGRFRELLGYSSDDFICFPNTFTAFEASIHPDDKARVMAAIQAHLHENAVYDIEYRLQLKNRDYRYFRAKGKALLNHDHVATRMAGSLTDITEQKLSQHQLQQAKERNDLLAQAIEASPVGVCIVDAKQDDMPLVYVNNFFTEMTGYKSDEILGKNCRFLQGEETDIQILSSLSKAISERRKKKVELLNYKKDGTPFWNSLLISPVFEEGQQLIAYVGVQQDITKRKQLDSYIDGITRESPSLLAYVDKDQIYRFVNQAYERWFGKTSHQFIDQHIRYGLGEDTYQILLPHIESALSGEATTFECEVIYPDHIQRYIRGIYTPHLDERGIVQGFFIAVDDISAFKKSERILLEAREVADAANNAKSEFLASMSHEIRTPMNGVLGMLELLHHTPLTEEQSHRVSIAQSSAQSLLTIINDILDFSKVDAGKMELEYIDFDLREMLSEFSAAIAHSVQEKKLEFIIDVTGIGASMVRGDPGRIRQVVTNLVANAVKFTAEGEVVVEAELSPMPNNNLKLICTVIDTGIGIPKDKQQLLFESFSQVDASTTRKFGGTGLGLAIVKKLCLLMNGDITVESTPNVGSRFTFTVELKRSVLPSKSLAQIDLTALNLLVVDDNATNRDLLMRQLESWGGNVVGAQSGLEALELCEQQWLNDSSKFFDSALIDIQMPEMDGVELAEQIIADRRFGAMTLVGMTSAMSKVDSQRFSDLGFATHFSKPAVPADLLSALAVVTNAGDTFKDAELLADEASSSVYPHSSKSQRIEGGDSFPLLLVEDNRVNQMVALGILKELGFVTVDLANNGAEAIRMLSSDLPLYSLIIMDCQMPIMDGYEASSQIRSGKAGARYLDVPIIAMTANAMAGDRERCIAAGMNDYLSKPIEPSRVRSKLRKWLHISDPEPSTSLAGIKSNEVGDQAFPCLENEKDVWQRQAALSRLMGDEALLDSLMQMYLEDMPLLISELKQTVEAADLMGCQLQAHAIKGMAGSLGAIEVERAALALEIQAKQNECKGIDALFTVLLKAHEAMQILLSDH